MGQVSERIERKLRMAFQPETLSVVDETNQHHGHAGWRESGETHFRVEITARAFSGKSRVERQRAVYQVLAEELTAGDGVPHSDRAAVRRYVNALRSFMSATLLWLGATGRFEPRWTPDRHGAPTPLP